MILTTTVSLADASRLSVGVVSVAFVRLKTVDLRGSSILTAGTPNR
jgi:hypothetical protein